MCIRDRFIVEEIEKDGEIAEKKTTVGIVYRSDGMRVFDSNIVPPEEYSEASRWSPAAQLPDYAIRRRATIISFEWKPLRSFSENDIKLLHLDYDSQNDPQLIMKEYLSTKNFDLLYSWWTVSYTHLIRISEAPPPGCRPVHGISIMKVALIMSLRPALRKIPLLKEFIGEL